MKTLKLFSLLLLLAPVARAQEPLSVQIAPNGETAISYRGLSLVPPGTGKPQLFEIYSLDANGAMKQHDVKGQQLTVDAAQKRFTIDVPAARIQVQYIPTGEHLHIYAKVENKSDTTFNIFSLGFFKLALPGLGQNAAMVDNQSNFAFAGWEFDKYKMALGNWEAERPVRVALEGRVQGDLSAGNLLTLVFRPSTLSHPVVDSRFWTTPGRNIPPGGTDTYHISLDFGSKTDDNIKDVLENFHKGQPSMVNWPDRRPIGRVFMANPTTGWPNNPRGYIFGKGPGNSVGTPEGHAQFTKDLMAFADEIIRHLKLNNAQGVIIWDIEGAWMPHPITYIGHPQMLPFVAPEMAPIADEFFQRIRAAGFKTGICIRPTEVFPTGQPWPPYNHRDVKDPVQLMSDKIKFAQEKWGCSMFYLDSNVYRIPTHLMPASMLRELKQRHPDVLIIPEWVSTDYYRYVAGYGHTSMGGGAAPPTARALWPDAFNVMVAEAPYLRANYDAMVRAVKAGDVLFFQAWLHSDENPLVNAIHQEAAFSNAPLAPELQKAAMDALLAAAKNENPQTRFQAAGLLGKSKDPRAVETLTAMIDDPNVVVARSALRGMGEVAKIQDLGQFRPTLDRLLALITKPLPPDRIMLRGGATGALTSVGKPVVDMLLPIALDPKQSPEARATALGTIGMMGYKTPEFIEALLGFIRDPNNDPMRMAAMSVSMALRLPEAVPAMADVLRNPASSPQSQVTAVQNLGIMARATDDFRGIEAMTLVFTRQYGPQMDAGVKGTANYHLGDATGQKFDGMGWRYLWMDRIMWEEPTPADTAAANESLVREARILRAGQPAGLGADAAALAQRIKDPDLAVRYHVAMLLGNSKDPQALAALGEMVADPDPLVANNALGSLRKVGPLPNEVLKKVWPVAVGQTADGKPMPRNSQYIRYSAFGVLAPLSEEAAGVVVGVAANQNEPIEVRIRALNTLRYFGKPFKSRAEGLQKLTTDPNPRISATAASILKG